MPLWTLIVLLALIKLPIAALMLWIPFRNDEAMHAPEPPDRQRRGRRLAGACPAGPLDPRPRRRCPPGRAATPAPRAARLAASPLPAPRPHAALAHARARASASRS